ncbi:arylsulfotransferase family protein [Burkholderia vietnamiensis]|uniref:arylsulfotransferase family protein n=1 Tax=Burkholderia vietnamiensis TaxID=60552 RepID=UPI001E4BAD57|nr:arylsulfotransferase family protein [Burkholderia vietnamiensis]
MKTLKGDSMRRKYFHQKLTRLNCKIKGIGRAALPVLLSSAITGCGGDDNVTSQVFSCATDVYPSNTGATTPAPILASPQVWSFVSAPNLHPMKVNVNYSNPAQLAEGLIFNSPYTGSNTAMYGQNGALIADNAGNPVWFNALNSVSLMNFDFRVQQYFGMPVLTFWQGTVATPPAYTNLPSGAAEPGACYYIVNNRYQTIKTVSARNGFVADNHEFLITPNNTGLFLATKVVPMDLTPYGGPKNGAIHDFSIQEVDLTTNELVFFWDAKDHIALESSHLPASTATATSNVWDPYHLNSLDLVANNNNDIVFSARSTWTVYRLHKPTGEFVWKLAGDGSGDFKIPAGNAQFSWQHDARYISDNIISMFDDACDDCYASIPPGTAPSHGLVLNLDFNNMVATAQTSYYHNPNLFSSAQGNTQWLGNGNKFIGWGNGYYTEFAQPGNTELMPATSTLYDVKMAGDNISYRTYRQAWVATPYYPPSVTVASGDSGPAVYASWNGSTETRSWQVYAGAAANNLRLIASSAKTGFETKIPLTGNSYAYVQVKAIDNAGAIIGVSDIKNIFK